MASQLNLANTHLTLATQRISYLQDKIDVDGLETFEF